MLLERGAGERASFPDPLYKSVSWADSAAAVLGGIDQNNVLTTIRNAEVLGDSTPALALECARRRRQLMRQMGRDSIAVLPAAPVRLRNNDVEYAYRQDSYFHYLTGFGEPESVAVAEIATWPVRVCPSTIPVSTATEGGTVSTTNEAERLPGKESMSKLSE